MAGAHDPTTSIPQMSPSTGGGDSNEAGDFECNICFELARDPVITPCGHLYCWPCLYLWLRGHSQAHDCPVCKALVVEEKVIPLYGRGKNPVDPRSKPIPGVEIPNRSAGQRLEAPHAAVDPNVANVLLGLMGGFVPIASATFNNFGMAAGFGGAFSLMFSVQIHGLSNRGSYGRSTGYRNGNRGSYGGSTGYRNGIAGAFQNREGERAMQAEDENLTKILLVIIIFLVLLFLL